MEDDFVSALHGSGRPRLVPGTVRYSTYTVHCRLSGTAGVNRQNEVAGMDRFGAVTWWEFCLALHEYICLMKFS